MSKIKVLPNFLINWLEDNDYHFDGYFPSDITKSDKDLLCYTKKGHWLWVEDSSGKETWLYHQGPPYIKITIGSTEEEFTHQVTQIYEENKESNKRQ